MATIVRTIDIDTTVDAVWKKLSDTARISDLIGFLASSKQNGDTRICQLDGGGELTEKIVSVDPELKRVMYSITESPLNMDFHAASMQVVDNAGLARLIWTVDLLPATVAEQMMPLLEASCADIKSVFTA